MANWCSNCFVVYGEDQILLKKFYKDMQKAVSEEFNKNHDWNKDWLGNLFLAAGYSLKEIEDGIICRGTIDCVTLKKKKNAVFLDTTTAWTPNDESMEKMIREKYPGLHIVYQAFEFGCDICETNDRERKFFPDSYFIDSCSDYGEIPEIYQSYKTANDVIEEIAKIGKITPQEVKEYWNNSGEKNLENVDWDEYLIDVLKLDRDEQDIIFNVHEICIV